MEDQIKDQIIMVRTCRKSSFGILEYQLKSISKAKMKRTISRRLTAANPQGSGRVNVLRCCLTCGRGALGFHLAAIRLWASAFRIEFQLFRFVLQHDSCSSLIVAMTDSSFQSIHIIMLLRESHARGRIQHESDWCWLSVVLNGEPDWSTTLVMLTSRRVDQRNRRSKLQPVNSAVSHSIVHTRGVAFLHCALVWRCEVYASALFMVCKKDLNPSPGNEIHRESLFLSDY